MVDRINIKNPEYDLKLLKKKTNKNNSNNKNE